MNPSPPIRDIGLVRRVRDDDDEALQKPLEWGLIRRLFTYTAPIKGKVTALVILSLVRAIQLPALVWIMAATISGPITARNVVALAQAVGAYGLLAIFTEGLFHFRYRYALQIAETVVNGLRAEIFARVQRQPMSFFHRVKIGRIIGRVTSDVEAVRAGIQDVLFVSMIQFGSMVFSATVMLWSDWMLFLVVLAMAPILWLLNRHFRVKLSQHTRASQESFSRVTATLAESVGGIRVTQGFVRQETNAGLFRRLLADHAGYNIALARTSAILTPLLELNSQFFIAVLLMFGGWRVFHGDMAMASLIAFFFFANQFFAPIAIIGNQYNQALVAMAGAERVFRLIDLKPDWEDDPAAVPLPDPRAGNGGGAPSPGGNPVSRGEGTPPPGMETSAGMRVEFRHVTFGYDPAKPVLHDLSFVVEPGQTVALVGHTGSGKSSIINLVAKFYLPSRGEVLVDGREIRTITSHSLHRQSGMVQQQNLLFSGTVLENIRLGRPDATEAEVREAARQLDCLDLFEALPQGFATEVGERGAALSLGQRQLVCFARALVADPRLVILDEATSSIDAATEARLQKALVTLLRGRTSFVVAHRLSTIRHADLVLVLDQGRVVERGTHASLLAQHGQYAALYRQFVQLDERA
ncbi:MAG TPA: ABC transporter ATP-binding protein [Lacunisphaera sp.]|nr:ABC transporter ATP-binding protein [Lacunisphaera sp.]